MKILGVDPGARATGWALLSFDASPRLMSAGVLRPPTSSPFGERLRALHEGLLSVIDRERPAEVAVERVFSGVNPQSLITLGEARGVLLLAIALRGLPTGELTPAEVKRAVTGSGNAEKEQVRRMVAALIPMETRRRLPFDAADAAAIALAWGHRIAARVARAAASPPDSAGPTDRRPNAFAKSSGAWRRRPSG